MEPEFARRASRRTSGDPEPGEGDFTRYAVEVTNLVHLATTEQVQELFRRLVGLCSVSYTPRSGKATVELSSRSNADTAVRLISTMRELAYSPSGKSWTLRARMLAINANLSFTQIEPPQRWQFVDDSALEQWAMDVKNDQDLMSLFDRLTHGGMKDSIQAEVLRKQGEGLVLKEIYLALGRVCELVFAGSRGQKDTLVLRSAEVVAQQHIHEFSSLFAELPPAARRTGVDATLHRISRSVHVIANCVNAITARVGRTIQGTVLPMLIDSSAADPIDALAHRAKKGLLLIGQPNVGKTTVLREVSRLLSAGDSRVVVIVDKSMEIAGTGVVPHDAIGNARVLTVEKPEDQAKVMIEAVENQSPDIIVVDELSNRDECNAARTITGRGVAIVATVHGDGIASLLGDHDRSLLVGGVASVTLSAREAEARPDKLRQVSRRYGTAVFGTAVELRGYTDWIVHEDLEAAVDSYLDYVPFEASWRQREGDQVLATPIVGCRQQGSSVGFAYARLRCGESLSSSDGVNFMAADPVSGQRMWTELGHGSKVYEQTQRDTAGSAAQAPGGFHFGARAGRPFQFGGDMGPFPNGGKANGE